MEGEGEERAGVLFSHGVDTYITDFSSIVSFILNCIATPSYELTRRLTSEQKSPSIPYLPSQIVKRTFDKEIICKPEDEENLIRFVKQLIGLKRKHFLSAMRAIKTYVTGMHRIADDYELAYTLIVASIESLAQAFDGHEIVWDDYDGKKRKRIDKALDSVEDSVRKQVRSAILENEYLSLGSRFRSFVLSHTAKSFFRGECVGAIHPIAREDLPSALRQAYQARSKYIHDLKELPKLLTLGVSHAETVSIDNKTWLTLQGLSRLARHVIVEFIHRQETVDVEKYDYRFERAGIIYAPLATQYWLGNAKNLTRESGHKKLEGFLEEYAAYIQNPQNAKLTDIREVLKASEKLLGSITKEERLPFIALYILFNALFKENERMPSFKTISEKYDDELSSESPESLILHLIFDEIPTWEISEHKSTLETYFKRREHKFGFRSPRILEAGMILSLAERYRTHGDFEQKKILLEKAVESYPESENLKSFEEKYLLEDDYPIDWKSILVPGLKGNKEGQ